MKPRFHHALCRSDATKHRAAQKGGKNGIHDSLSFESVHESRKRKIATLCCAQFSMDARDVQTASTRLFRTICHRRLVGLDQPLDALRVRFAVSVTRERIGAAGRFYEDLRPEHARPDVD